MKYEKMILSSEGLLVSVSGLVAALYTRVMLVAVLVMLAKRVIIDLQELGHVPIEARYIEHGMAMAQRLLE
jgi:hypothetical protein